VSRRWRRLVEWVAVPLILLLAAVLRFWALGDVPPGLAHDEVANWLIARDILAGRHAIYFTAAYGHEPLYQYAQAATVALFGDHWLGLRYPSAAFGLLGLAATYVLVRRLFGASVALLTAGWLAVSFWPLFYARVALRAITLPFTAALAAYFLLRAIPLADRQHLAGRGDRAPTDHRRWGGAVDWALAGLFLGLSLYTYMAARVLPAIVVAFLIYACLVSPDAADQAGADLDAADRRRSGSTFAWSGLLTFLLATAIVSAPLAIWLATHPGAEYRISEVREPLDRLLAGDPSLVWGNLVANFKLFTFAGDPWPRQNLPGRPVFAEPLSGILFYAGLIIALWRWRDRRYGFLLLWLAGALVPSVVTSDAPSSIRDILGLVVVFAFPALALVEICRWAQRRVGRAGRGTPVVGLLVLVPCLFLTARDYFLIWPAHDVVRFDYQAQLTAVAHRLDELPSGTPVAVAGLSVHTMDGPGLDLAARRDVCHVRLCDTRETLVIPAGRAPWLFVPQVVPLDADLRRRLLRWGAVEDAAVAEAPFVGYRLRRDLGRLETAAALPDGASVALPVSFGGRLAFLGYEWLQGDLAAGDTAALLTYWRIESPADVTLKVFVHLTEDGGEVVTQHDGLGSPPRGWQTGDVIVQRHVLPLPSDTPPGSLTPTLGVYEARDVGARLAVKADIEDAQTDAMPAASAVDTLLLPPVEVSSP